MSVALRLQVLARPLPSLARQLPSPIDVREVNVDVGGTDSISFASIQGLRANYLIIRLL